MATLEILGFLLGVMIVLKMIFLLIAPKDFLVFWKKKLDDQNVVKGTSLLSILAGALFLFVIYQQLTLMQFIIAGAAFAMLFKGLMIYLFPDIVPSVIKDWMKKGDLLRIISLVGMVFGIWLLVQGYPYILPYLPKIYFLFIFLFFFISSF